jgi:hypothetical protein
MRTECGLTDHWGPVILPLRLPTRWQELVARTQLGACRPLQWACWILRLRATCMPLRLRQAPRLPQRTERALRLPTRWQEVVARPQLGPPPPLHLRLCGLRLCSLRLCQPWQWVCWLPRLRETCMPLQGPCQPRQWVC